MRIKKLKIQNFRSIENLDIELPQICSFVGPNNSGKSNILLALKKVLYPDWVTVSSFSEEDVYKHCSDKDIKIEISIDPCINYKKIKDSDDAEITSLSFEYCRYKATDKIGQRRLEQKCFDANGKIPSVLANRPKKGFQNKYEPIIGIPAEVRESIPLIYIGTNRSIKEQLPSSRYSLLRELLTDIDRNFNSSDKLIDYDGKEIKQSDCFKLLIDKAMNLLRTEDFVKLEEAIKNNALNQLGFDPTTDSDKLDFFFSPFSTMDFYRSLDLCVKEGDFVIRASELGEGIQNALVLAILQAFEERKKQGAILLIEEPEMFLHPQMQRSLYKTFREIGKNNQILYTTHSPHFVSVPNYDEVILVRKNHTGTSLTKSNLSIDAKRREKIIKELDSERNEMFFAKKLLLVEGDTEKLAFPEYAKRLKIDLDKAGITIVEVGGKRNLDEFAKIAISFNIPTGIVYDTDSSDFKNKRADEIKFNQNLDSYAKEDGSVKVWYFQKNYEDHLRETIGETNYQTLCQKYENTAKPTRARLIATETEYAIPPRISEIINWLYL